MHRLRLNSIAVKLIWPVATLLILVFAGMTDYFALTLHELDTTAKDVTSHLGEMVQVSESTTRQSSTVEEINATIHSFTNQIEQSNTAILSTSSVAIQLIQRVTSLKNDIAQFKV